MIHSIKTGGGEYNVEIKGNKSSNGGERKKIEIFLMINISASAPDRLCTPPHTGSRAGG